MPASKYEEVEIQNYGVLGGRYRVRLVEEKRGRRLDVREYIDKAEEGGYVGFTRKGIRLDRAQAGELVEILRAALKAGL